MKPKFEVEQENEFNSPTMEKTSKSMLRSSQRKISGFESPNYMVFMRKESAISMDDLQIN